MELTHYDVLGVEPTADLSTIRAAYRRRARDTHPDAGGDADAFARVARAWEVLSSAELRVAYDAELAGEDDSWGTAVGFDAPMPGPPPAGTDPPADQDDVAGVPPKRVHLGTTHGQERRRLPQRRHLVGSGRQGSARGSLEVHGVSA